MLTKKEIEILKLKKKGLTQVEISKILKISQPAVSGFYNNALKKIKEAKKVLELAKKLKIKIEED
jgi:transcriptional regulator